MRLFPTIFIASILLIRHTNAQVIINEIMFNPSGSEPANEWVELWNYGSSSVDISGWLLGDAAGTATISPGGALVIPPGEYLILCASNLTFSCQTSVVAGWRSLNNSGDEVVKLVSNTGELVDSVNYTADGHPENVSIERKNPLMPGYDRSNWSASTDPTGSTPCRENTVIAPPIDLAISNLYWLPESIQSNSEFTVFVIVQNFGRNNATGYTLHFLINQDETAVLDTVLALPSISSGAVETLSISHSLPQGIYELSVSVDDTVGANNSISRTLLIGVEVANAGLIISEFMYKPITSPVEEPEWIELYNPTDYVINLNGWKISDRSYISTITNQEIYVLPHRFVVLAKFIGPPLDTVSCNVIAISNWPYLNNDSDCVRLYTPDSLIVDSYCYKDSDFPCMNYGVSLENAGETGFGNFSCSRSGSTPCGRNSLWFSQAPGAPEILVTPNPFDPRAGENASIVVKASLNASIQIRIYNVRGEIIRDFGNIGIANWDGKSDSGDDVPPGPYIIVAKVTEGGKSKYYRSVVALASGMRK